MFHSIVHNRLHFRRPEIRRDLLHPFPHRRLVRLRRVEEPVQLRGRAEPEVGHDDEIGAVGVGEDVGAVEGMSVVSVPLNGRGGAASEGRGREGMEL